MIWIIRHADTEWSATLRHTGRTDLPLSAAGREEAGRLRERLGGIDFEAVICSPMRRAKETAELAGLVWTREDANLEEWDYGEYEGLTTVEIRHQRPGWDMWRDGTPGGEDAAAVGARADAALAGLAADGADRGDGRGDHGDVRGEDGDRRADHAIAVVAHGHFLRVLTARWLGLPPADGALFALEPSGIGRLGHEHGRRVLCGWGI
jgi:broad specificity phosphatase PhoE